MGRPSSQGHEPQWILATREHQLKRSIEKSRSRIRPWVCILRNTAVRLKIEQNQLIQVPE